MQRLDLLTIAEVESPLPAEPEPLSAPPESGRNSYRGVVLVLMAAALLGAAAAYAGGRMLANPVLFDVAVTMVLATGVLSGVAIAMTARSRPPKDTEQASISETDAEHQTLAHPSVSVEVAEKNGAPAGEGPPAEVLQLDLLRARLQSHLAKARVRIGPWLKNLDVLRIVSIGTGAASVLAIGLVVGLGPPPIALSPLIAGIAAAVCLVAAGLASTAAHYLAGIELARFPEGPWLRRGALVVAWIFVLAALSMGLAWARQQTIIRILHFVVLVINAFVCYGLFTVRRTDDKGVETFPLNLGVLSVLGERTNILASVLDAAEQQLGIDLRSTWALSIVRRGLEPLAIGLLFVGWLSTSLTVVGVEEQGLVERLGVPVGGEPLLPGLHLHWPWPVDRVFRIPVQRVHTTTVGHEGEEAQGPENVLWARQHAANEYTLLLGNGRDLITVDAAVQFRIKDARAWRYHSQNPGDALRAIAYRAVMRSTVNRTLSEALSENVVALTSRMRAMVQDDADALGLGIQVVAFTVGGMHPPVSVAPDYQSVVSAEIAKVTAVVNAEVYRNRTVPAAEASALARQNDAQAAGAQGLGKAAGEAWSFRTLESQYRAEPQDYFFRRRLETLENGLAGRVYTVVDFRFQRDGGELWLIP
jgi:regulator of protease activity HflC (stomatin/prohibitin superfamily)